jgi:hypothetical protein
MQINAPVFNANAPVFQPKKATEEVARVVKPKNKKSKA